MNDFENTLNRIDSLCEQNKIQYAVIGGLAVITYGSNRTTKDIDITVLCELDELEKIFEIFSKEFNFIHPEPLLFFQQNFVLPSIDKTNEIRVDIASGLTGFDKSVIEKRNRIKLGKAEFYVCSIEDLIIYKLFAARFQDFADVKALLALNIKKIDFGYLNNKVLEFLNLEREDMKDNLEKLMP